MTFGGVFFNYQHNSIFLENPGLLSGIDIVPYYIPHQLNLCWIQMEMDGVYIMV